jgi:cytoskeletal protein RodZ
MDYADFGRFLTQQRELRGMSRADVAKTTRIPDSVLVALEDGQVDRLPGRVFVLNYIRAYAQVIGMSADEVVLRFEEIDTTLKSTPPPPALERQRRRRAWVGLFALGLAVVIAIVLGAQLLGGEAP